MEAFQGIQVALVLGGIDSADGIKEVVDDIGILVGILLLRVEFLDLFPLELESQGRFSLTAEVNPDLITLNQNSAIG